MQTGKKVVKQAKGVDSYWNFHAADPAFKELFAKAMSDFCRHQLRAVIDVYDFSGVESIVDVAGDRGSFGHDFPSPVPLTRLSQKFSASCLWPSRPSSLWFATFHHCDGAIRISSSGYFAGTRFRPV